MRKYIVGVVSFLLMMVLCSCSGLNKTPNESQILSDYLAKSVDLEYANFSAVEITRSQLNKEEKTFLADITLTGKDEYADYLCSSSVLYNYYDDQGWMLDEITSRELTTTCYTGRTFEELEEDILTNYTTYLPVDGCFNVEDYLDQNMQLVTFVCETINNHLTTTYDVSMYFRYANGNWFMDSVEKNPSNFRITLEGTRWVEKQTSAFIDRGDWYITIKKISADSKTIVFEYEGTEYTGTLISNYTESGFKGGAEYKLNKPMDRGTRSWTVYEEKMYMTALEIYSTEVSPYIKYDTTFESDLKNDELPSWGDWSRNKFTMVNS